MISANLEGLFLGTAIEKLKQAAERIKMAPGYRVVYSGEAEDMAESFGYMAEALLLAIIMVYLILAAQFESFIDPLAIMLSLPLSVVGMAGCCTSRRYDQYHVLIGLIMLMGLVTKNAILFIDFTRTLRSRGMDGGGSDTAGRIGCGPSMMTTLAMIFWNASPGPGHRRRAEMRAPWPGP